MRAAAATFRFAKAARSPSLSPAVRLSPYRCARAAQRWFTLLLPGSRVGFLRLFPGLPQRRPEPLRRAPTRRTADRRGRARALSIREQRRGEVMQPMKFAAPAVALLAMATTTDVMAQVTTQERPISLDQPRTVAQVMGQLEISGFAIGSINYNSHIQMVPEFAGGAQALSDPRQTNFRFDKFGLAFNKRFGPTLSVMAAVEIESHRDKHTHLRTDPTTQCVGVPVPCESFGAEESTTESTLDKLAVTWFPWSSLGFSFGRFDVPFGIERHDEVLNMTATTSQIS